MAQKVGQRHDAQLLEPLGGLGAYPLQVAHRRVRREGDAGFGKHGVSAPFLWQYSHCNTERQRMQMAQKGKNGRTFAFGQELWYTRKKKEGENMYGDP